MRDDRQCAETEPEPTEELRLELGQSASEKPAGRTAPQPDDRREPEGVGRTAMGDEREPQIDVGQHGEPDHHREPGDSKH